ncbi:hypothetical protein LCGC14_2059780, partial [marine sediment metagenome]
DRQMTFMILEGVDLLIPLSIALAFLVLFIIIIKNLPVLPDI